MDLSPFLYLDRRRPHQHGLFVGKHRRPQCRGQQGLPDDHCGHHRWSNIQWLGDSEDRRFAAAADTKRTQGLFDRRHRRDQTFVAVPDARRDFEQLDRAANQKFIQLSAATGSGSVAR